MTPLERTVRQHLADYLAGVVSVESLESRLVSVTWEWDSANEEAAESLTNELFLRLAEFSRGHWTEEDLRRLLLSLQPSWVSIAPPQSGTLAEVTAVRISESDWWRSADTPAPTASSSVNRQEDRLVLAA